MPVDQFFITEYEAFLSLLTASMGFRSMVVVVVVASARSLRPPWCILCERPYPQLTSCSSLNFLVVHVCDPLTADGGGGLKAVEAAS